MTRVTAQVQKLFDIDVKNPPVIKVAKHVKKDNLRPILSGGIILLVNKTLERARENTHVKYNLQ